jgi:hypothetical protein
MTEEKGKSGIFFEKVGTKYPGWRYHKFLEPMIVKDTAADEDAAKNGWHEIQESITVVPHLTNWRFDLEDMSARQLLSYARDEFDIDLPVEAGKEKLLKVLWRLHVMSPKNRDRMVILAQTVKFDLEEAYREIREAVKEPQEVFTEEFYG